MPQDETDIARAEFEALRAELLAKSQSQAGATTAALTIIAAIGGFALAEDGRREMLLALPLVLGGLAIQLVDGVLWKRRVGDYLREHLWKSMPPTPPDRFRSWEHFALNYRATNPRLQRHVVSGVIPVLLIFVAPSVASLVITRDEAFDDLWPLWWAGVVALVLFAVLGVSLRERIASPTLRKPPG